MKNGNDPAAGSPTATLLRLLLPLTEMYWWNSNLQRASPKRFPSAFTSKPSVATTGGVYKWQGPNQDCLLSDLYEAFLVQD
jgi:hypothetical protein